MDTRYPKKNGYTYGPSPIRLVVAEDVTKDTFMNMCDDLSKRLALIYPQDVCTVRPEAITEGGFIFSYAPGYKSFRFSRMPSSTPRWPIIRGDENVTWRGNQDIVFAKGTAINPFLKARHGAPVWTADDIIAVTVTLAKYGIIQRPKLPKKLSSCRWMGAESPGKCHLPHVMTGMPSERYYEFDGDEYQ